MQPVERFTFVLGPCVFALLLLAGIAGLIWDWDGLTFGDFLQAAAGGSGLLAVGHGLHRSARLGRQPEDHPS
jgi:hypothetical protein